MGVGWSHTLSVRALVLQVQGAELSAKQHLQDEYFSYDKMGNILSLQRKNFGNLFDDLTFEYNGNQLKKVDDANGSGTWYDLTAYTNYSTAAVSDFTYDANGNMTSDLDKNIVTIRYNVLNLPELIQFKNGNQMQNVYSASGQKLRTKYYTLYSPVLMPIGATKTDYTTSNSSLRIDDYMGNMLYEGGSSEAYHPLTKILTSEGYIDYTDRQYCYFKKDHLGSIREVGKHIGNDRVVVQKTQYYPSGTPYWECFKPGEQAYKFTGKELITMHGLNWQDYDARWLDNVRMSWTSVDPLAELMPGISPYAYCYNNPMKYIDPTGMAGMDYSKDMWGREKYDSFTGVYIPPMDRPGGMTAKGYGNSQYGYFKETLTGFSANYWTATCGSYTAEHYEELSPIYETEWIWYEQEERMYGRARNLSDSFYAANSLISTIGTGTGLLKHELIQNYKAGGNVDEILEAAKQLKKISKPVALIGKALGIVSVVQHGAKVIDALNQEKIDWKSLTINGGKLVLDGIFIVGKSVNPVFLTASVAYGVVDYITDEY